MAKFSADYLSVSVSQVKDELYFSFPLCKIILSCRNSLRSTAQFPDRFWSLGIYFCSHCVEDKSLEEFHRTELSPNSLQIPKFRSKTASWSFSEVHMRCDKSCIETAVNTDTSVRNVLMLMESCISGTYTFFKIIRILAEFLSVWMHLILQPTIVFLVEVICKVAFWYMIQLLKV